MNINVEEQIRLPISSMLFYRESYLTFNFLKRSCDIVLAILVILLLFPILLPFISLLIKVGSKGNIFYIQQRVGYNGKIFNCLKFRTMTQDGREITQIGRLLRNTGLDEIPQFFNVLKNDMSIIGPRPYSLDDHRNFSVYIEEFTLRNRVKPGITGLAQVLGHKGPVKNITELGERTSIDLIYINNRSIIQEWNIALQTSQLIIKELIHSMRRAR